VESRYHQTWEILSLVKHECSIVPELTCVDNNGILSVNWLPTTNGKVTLFSFNEHAREKITGELGLEFILRLKIWRPRISLTIVPILNVWGRRVVDSGRSCQRKNRHGVDINRNFQSAGKRHRYPKWSDEYEGREPLSETESVLISNMLRSKDVFRYINVHSGEWALYTPYDSTSAVHPANYDRMISNVNQWSRRCPICVAGGAASVSSYRAWGTSVEWAVDHGVSEAYTFEIYGNHKVSGCREMFNPPVADKDNVIELWLGILKEIVNTV